VTVGKIIPFGIVLLSHGPSDKDMPTVLCTQLIPIHRTCCVTSEKIEKYYMWQAC